MVSRQPEPDVFTAIADQTRRALLQRLAAEGEKNVTQLTGPFAMSQPAISKHLRILRETGLIESRKQGRMMLYRIRPQRLLEVYEWVAHFEKYWDDKLDSLGDFLENQKRK